MLICFDLERRGTGCGPRNRNDGAAAGIRTRVPGCFLRQWEAGVIDQATRQHLARYGCQLWTTAASQTPANHHL